ncbi:hypothetical protein [Bradyrhizobium sp. B120]|uniref:hypothetical protein n=1 Tax=Bradyrhizobium sp. B120 TaxID=3410088 RepID=UPI003B97FE67
MRVLRSWAKSFVATGWIVFVLSIPICVAIGASAGFSFFYFPTRQTAPLDAFDVTASQLVLASAAFAAVASSIAFALKLRATASVLVVVIWSTTVVGTLVARSFVKPGPEYFERHLGQQVFLVPWQYVSAGHGQFTAQSPHEIGFSANLCLSNLKGRQDQDCRSAQQIYILPKERDFVDPEFWRMHRSEMNPEPERSGYQSFAYGSSLSGGGPTHIDHYFARQDSSGQLTRLVVCRLEVFCTHHALVGAYWLKYNAPLEEGDALDDELAALIESWRRK